MEAEKKSKPNKRAKGRCWIPPPALTSSLDKEKAAKSNPKPVRTDDSESCGCDNAKHSEFETKLKGLLHEIHQLKSYVSSDKNEHELLERKDKIVNSTKAVEELEKTIEKAIEELRLLQKDDSAYRRSFATMKDELHKNLEENERLTNQQKSLVEKLSRVERNATEAVEHVIALKNFINKLKLNDFHSFSPQSSLKYTEEILTKIQELDRAKQSLQKIISDTPHTGSDNREVEENAKTALKSTLDNPHIVKLTEKVKELQGNLEEDRRHIMQLQATVYTVRQESLKEKEELRKTANQHREKANKYLSVVDDLKLQLSKMRNELGDSKQEMGSLKLQIMCLTSERDRLGIEKTTLMGKCAALESQTASRNLAMTSQSEELSSKLMQFSSKINILELDNEKLKAQLEDSKREIERCKSDLRWQQEELRGHQKNNERNADKMDSKKVAHKSVQASLAEPPNSSPLKEKSSGVSFMNRQSSEGQEHWMQMTELWKELQNDKQNILQVLKDLEGKLEKSQDVNSEFRRELSKKEDIMQEINSKLQEKIEENKSLKQMLETAITEAKQMSERAKETSFSLDQVTRSNLAELEKQVHEYKMENSQLRKSKSEVEKNLSLQIKDLQERLDLVEKSKKALHEYIVFLKSSYASVFGDASLATKNYAF